MSTADQAPGQSEGTGTGSGSGTVGEVFRAFLKLGLTSFGGPIAHLGYFRDELVTRRRWVRESEYADLIALGQFLPGPASSQVGFALGLFRAGPWGGLAAWAAFTLPSAALMVAFAFGASLFEGWIGTGVLTGLKIVAVAIVAQAVWGMARALTPDARRASIAVAAAGLVLLMAGPLGQIGAIALGAVAGFALCRNGAGASQSVPPGASQSAFSQGVPPPGLGMPVSRRAGVVALSALVALLVGLQIAAAAAGAPDRPPASATAPAPPSPLQVADSFFRAGALVFGGGHVVLPLLQSETVMRSTSPSTTGTGATTSPTSPSTTGTGATTSPTSPTSPSTSTSTGWVSPDEFLAGYGAVQAVPGPLFTFAAYLGALAAPGPAGLATAALALVAVFLPGILLLLGVLPFWNTFRTNPAAQSLMRGANASVVGILGAALYNPVFLSAVVDPASFILALACFALLVSWRTPPWAVVLVGAAGGVLLAWLSAA